MAARTGQQYLAGLRGEPAVWLGAEKVDVTTHPAFAGPSSPDSTAGVPHPFVAQDGEQPSPGARLPSSHASYAGASTPSPQ